jgi:hypothetical protein
VGEDRLDDLLAFSIKRRALGGAQQLFDSLRLGTLPWCFLSRRAACGGLGRDDSCDVALFELSYLRGAPVASVGEDHLQRFGDPGGRE